MEQFKDQVAIITGAGNNGIGWGLAKHTALDLEMHVVLVDLHLAVVKGACSELRKLAPNRHIVGLQCDVTKIEELEQLAKVVNEKLGDYPIGMVFANAGVIFNNTILKSSLEDWRITLEVNVLGVVSTAKVFIPILERQATGSIFCPTASVGGLVRGDGGAASYQASKHAVVALTESLSFEIAKKSPHVRICVLCPCIVSSSLALSSLLNKSVSKGEASDPLEQIRPASSEFAMTPENHAKQVFDLIGKGKFYLVTDNVRPYVEHDYPF